MSQADEKWKSLYFRDPLENDEVNMDRFRNKGGGNPFGGKPHVWPKYSGQTYTIYKSNFASIDTESDEDSIMPDSFQDLKTSLNGRTKIRLMRKYLNQYLANNPQIPTLGRVLLVPSPSMTFNQIKNSDLHYWKQRNDKVSKLTSLFHKPKIDTISPRDSSLDRSMSREELTIDQDDLDQMELETDSNTRSEKEEQDNQYLNPPKHKKQKLDLPYTSIRTRMMRLLNRKGKFCDFNFRFHSRRNPQRDQIHNVHLYIIRTRKTETIIRIKHQGP
jgi:hypothetical protein